MAKKAKSDQKIFSEWEIYQKVPRFVKQYARRRTLQHIGGAVFGDRRAQESAASYSTVPISS